MDANAHSCLHFHVRPRKTPLTLIKKKTAKKYQQRKYVFITQL